MEYKEGGWGGGGKGNMSLFGVCCSFLGVVVSVIHDVYAVMGVYMGICVVGEDGVEPICGLWWSKPVVVGEGVS